MQIRKGGGWYRPEGIYINLHTRHPAKRFKSSTRRTTDRKRTPVLDKKERKYPAGAERRSKRGKQNWGFSKGKGGKAWFVRGSIG